ncbi:MAG: TRIC cation channel family protein [Alphaproteobacteria bacterium]|nr:TRIC cation channel family protein [Alphaproteobacteria bacterium]
MDLGSEFGEVVGTSWFVTIDVIGTVAFALSGITIARSERYSLFGAFVLAALPAVGGGLIMDLIANRNPVGILAQPSYVIAIIVVVLSAKLVMTFIDLARGRLLFFFDLAYLYVRLQSKIQVRTLLLFWDSVGLASFTVTGVFTAIQFDCRPLVIWGPVFAVLNAAFGAVLRDVFRADANNPILKGTFYAEVAFLWGLLLTLFMLVAPQWAVATGIVVTIAGATAMRTLLARRNLQAPMF